VLVLYIGVRFLVYGGDVQRGFKSMGTQLHPKTTVVKGVLDEAADLMKRFLHLKKIELVTLSKYFLPLLFRDYNYRTGCQPIPPVIFY
jgi:hypothetical protein